MATPPTVLPGKAYLHVSTSKDPSSIASSMSNHAQWNLHYIGPVGELSGEHLFEVQQPSGAVLERSAVQERDLVQTVKDATGVKGVKLVEMKQRAKRDEL